MQREEIVQICNREVLAKASKLYNTRKDALTVFPGYEGAANLVYEYGRDGRPLILRISFTPERSADQIEAELHFVNYLAEHGIRVSRPAPSRNGGFLNIFLLPQTHPKNFYL
ncbi:MAG: phosphotransferase [Anaerolineales bacterium]|nr:phosphotransferase [Anaerolineales bacterium]